MLIWISTCPVVVWPFTRGQTGQGQVREIDLDDLDYGSARSRSFDQNFTSWPWWKKGQSHLVISTKLFPCITGLLSVTLKVQVGPWVKVGSQRYQCADWKLTDDFLDSWNKIKFGTAAEFPFSGYYSLLYWHEPLMCGSPNFFGWFMHEC